MTPDDVIISPGFDPPLEYNYIHLFISTKYVLNWETGFGCVPKKGTNIYTKSLLVCTSG